jgi:hypothetical protein
MTNRYQARLVRKAPLFQRILLKLNELYYDKTTKTQDSQDSPQRYGPSQLD